jgi:predicted aspartyl protease
VRVEPEVNFELPPASVGCSAATALPGGATRVPMTVSTVAGQVAELVNVCIGGTGPYPFVLDTGAGQSTIDAGLARRLHLPVAGQSTVFAGVGCTGTAQPVSVATWSLEGVDLAPQDLTAAKLPQIGGRGEPVGLLGSDVMARFGGVRVDFDAGALVLPRPEGAPLDSSGSYTGPVGPPPDPVLTQGGGTTVPLTVQPQPGNVSLNVAVRFAGGPRRSFVVDTGSSQSVVATTAGRAASLTPTDLAQRQATVCSVITVPLVHSGLWSVPGQALHPQLVGETDFGTISLGGTQGLLGSDQLRRYGWVVFDYTGARMVLG